MRDLTVSVIQAATHWHDAPANQAMYGDLVRACPRSDLIVLPETFLSGFSNDAAASAPSMHSNELAWLRALSRDVGSVLTGSLVIAESGQVFNRMFVVYPDGGLQHYDKRHLFRMAGEHQRYGGGRERLIVDVAGWRICPLVCYDLRFPVYARNRHNGEHFDYDLLLFVANWPSPRRGAWRTLLRARAIENLSYCIGVNRVGSDGNGLHYSGDSAVIDPLGEALVDLGAQPQVVTVALSRAALDAHRERFPAQLDADQFTLHL